MKLCSFFDKTPRVKALPQLGVPWRNQKGPPHAKSPLTSLCLGSSLQIQDSVLTRT